MKKLTVRVDDYIYDRLLLLSKQNKMTVNKIIGNIIKQKIDNTYEENILELVYENLNIIKNKINTISKKQSLHFDISLQHFVNHGYFENVDPKDDKCFNELKNKNNYYE